MTGLLYILDGKTPKPEPDRLKWTEWMHHNIKRRCLARSELCNATVSTVFIGVNHRFGEGPPLLFETIVFGGKLDHKIERYATWDGAMAGHKRMVERVKELGE